MRALLVFVVLGVLGSLVLPALAQRSRKVMAPVDRRFDHAEHGRLVKARTGKDETCSTCHAMSASGRWSIDWNDQKEHQRCFAGCHGGFTHTMTTDKSALRGPAGRVCYPCHATRLKYRPEPAQLGKVASRTETVYVATYSHGRHMAAGGAAAGAQCERCHGELGSSRNAGTLMAGHSYCAECHGREQKPRMSECSGCHVSRSSDAGRTPVMKPRAANRYAVTGAFDHARHGKQRVGAEGRACQTCHANIASAADPREIPLPTMQSCHTTCHDGKKAFSAIGTTCTRCHQGGRP